MCDQGFYWPILSRIKNGIREIKLPGVQAVPGAPVLLALSTTRFRGDLEHLAATGQVRVLALEKAALNLFTNLHYDGVKPAYAKLHNEGADPLVSLRQRRFHSFLQGFLPVLFDELGVDAVLSAAFYYSQDQDIGMLSERVGRPWIVLHRENLVTSDVHKKRVVSLCDIMQGFKGSLVVVHNESMRKTMVDCGFAPADRVKALGCTRMDEYVERVKHSHPKPRTRKRVTLFSFVHGAGLFGVLNAFSPKRDVGFVRMFEDTHAIVARLALEHPEIDFVIKPKWIGGGWKDEIDNAIRLAGGTPDHIANLTVTDALDAQELIFDSDVVIGFGSTTLLEAAIAGKPVIQPLFHEATDPFYQQFLIFREEAPRIFHVARSPDEYRAAILASLDNPIVPKEVMRARWEAFETYISDPSANSVDQYVAAIKETVRERRSLRGA